MSIGIVGYGGCIPRFRIKVEEIATVWGEDGKRMSESLNVYEKSVPGIDEDAATIAVEAARNAIEHAKIDPQEIGALFIGSESHPYAVKPTSTIVAEAVMATPNLMAADLEFACKAGTAGIQMCMGLVKAGMIKYGMAIGTDTSQGKPGDVLEYTVSAGGAAYIIGKENLIAEILDTYSFTTDTSDFWRREHVEFPSHGGRFTGAPAYFRHVMSAASKIMERNNLKPDDFKWAVFHQPNGKFPLEVGKKLNFKKEQIALGLLTPYVGNTYSGATLLGVANVLDYANEGDLILAASFGSGAGSDAFIITVSKENEKRRNHNPIKKYIDDKEYVDYATYAKFKGKIKGIHLRKE